MFHIVFPNIPHIQTERYAQHPQPWPPAGVAYATLSDELVITSVKFELLYEPILCRIFVDENKTFHGGSWDSDYVVCGHGGQWCPFEGNQYKHHVTHLIVRGSGLF
jgi:hypothetical protein